ncbi:MAG: nuclear transport factor 2 family protein [Deltaproteobacteria bacterium]|nr:nuclear transport factor 2 family protein [Deltaproteobacteria bacterium]
MDPRVARLLDKQEIQEVVYAYCRGIDRRDLDLVRACYHPDATDEHGSFSGTIDAYLEWVDGLLARYTWTMHFVGNILIDFSSEEINPESNPGGKSESDKVDVAAAESYGISLHRSEEVKPYLNLAIGFRYLDRFERREDRWKIAERVAVSEWSIQIPGSAWWEIPDSLRKGQRNRGDALYALLSRLHSKP